MILRFEQCVLDSARFELRVEGVPMAVEPQVLSLLLLLASNPDRLVSKDELIEKIWDGRIVSESAVAARIKSARRAIGDDGAQQRLIRTVHGKGFRFVGAVQFDHVAQSTPIVVSDIIASSHPAADPRPSIAVLPFRVVGDPGLHAVLADALADELIADLARLRWLFVIARGSSFRFRGPELDYARVGESLGARYCLTGGLTFAGGGVTVSAELIDTASGGVVWAETWSEAIERLLDLRIEIATQLVSALEISIAAHEAELARGRPVEALDAWSAYHLGLDHMFRFNRADNARAAALFERTVAIAPDFARGYAGLSFTRFQNAFLNYGSDRDREAEAARSLAEEALNRDRLDPFCRLNVGRALWLDGGVGDSIEWFDRAIALSPSYAQAVYAKAWASTVSGEAVSGEESARLALKLSPLDPLRYAMLATRSLAQIFHGNYEAAATLGERAARSPGAHKHIAVIAAIATMLDGRRDKAAEWIARARRADPALTAADFLRSFPFPLSEEREMIERVLTELGL